MILLGLVAKLVPESLGAPTGRRQHYTSQTILGAVNFTLTGQQPMKQSSHSNTIRMP